MTRVARVTGPFAAIAFLYAGAALLDATSASPAGGFQLALALGVAVAGAMIATWQAVPAVLMGAFVVGLIRDTALASVMVGAGDAAIGMAVSAATSKALHGPHMFQRPRRILLFAAASVALLGPAGIFVRFAAFMRGSGAPESLPAGSLAVGWLAGAMACLIVTPAIVLGFLQVRELVVRRRRTAVTALRRRGGPSRHAVEALAFALVVLAASPMIFAGWPPVSAAFPGLELALLPILGWVTLRFGVVHTAAALVILSVGAIWGVAHGVGPFVASTSGTGFLQAHFFLVVLAVTALTMAASVDERNRQDSELHELAITDPLTGLANYRHLTAFIDREIERSVRSLRPFAVVLLDVDNLKTINDQLGHNVGSRLLVRLADILRASCRVTDLIARYGGDEFAIVLPGCDEETARARTTRLQKMLMADRDTPTISVSLGVAIYPRDGAVCDELLDAADNELYAMKGRSKSRSQVYGAKRA